MGYLSTYLPAKGKWKWFHFTKLPFFTYPIIDEASFQIHHPHPLISLHLIDDVLFTSPVSIVLCIYACLSHLPTILSKLPQYNRTQISPRPIHIVQHAVPSHPRNSHFHSSIHASPQKKRSLRCTVRVLPVARSRSIGFIHTMLASIYPTGASLLISGIGMLYTRAGRQGKVR